MICAWKELLSILPPWLRRELDKSENEGIQELRLRTGAPVELRTGETSRWLENTVTEEDIRSCVQLASRYSPWNAATASQGYLTARGGHRIGLCGEAVCREGRMEGIREVSSICIRVARDFPGLARGLRGLTGSVLILGAPGWGKTTLLRDLIRQLSDQGEHITVVDQRGELFPGTSFPTGRCTDILTGIPKAQGISCALRTMGPSCIALDEITDRADCDALIQAGHCGVRLLATAHAVSLSDLHSRPVYRALLDSRIFSDVVVLHRDKSWHLERISK